MTGYKTYLGLFITVAGLLGWTKYFTPEQITTVVTDGFEIVGIVLSIVGAIHKDIRLSDAGTK